MNTILFMPTMRCNLKCECCHFVICGKDRGYTWNGYGKEHKIIDEVDWYEWKCHLEKLAPYHLEFSGGEPLLFRDFPKLVNDMNVNSSWAITSNTLLYEKNINLLRCKHWTASWHGKNRDLFLENITHIEEQGCPVSVSVVVEFANVDKWLQDAYVFRNAGFGVNLLRELNPDVSWTDTLEWKDVIAMKRFGFNVVEDDIPPSYDFDSGFMCGGGSNYMCAMPDGQVYRCYSEAMLGEPLGHIGEIHLKENGYECKSKCLACALDYKFRGDKLIKQGD